MIKPTNLMTVLNKRLNFSLCLHRQPRMIYNHQQSLLRNLKFVIKNRFQLNKLRKLKTKWRKCRFHRIQQNKPTSRLVMILPWSRVNRSKPQPSQTDLTWKLPHLQLMVSLSTTSRSLTILQNSSKESIPSWSASPLIMVRSTSY